MATQGVGGGSHLSTLAARRASLQKTRERLNLSNGGGDLAQQRPQANVQAPAPTPKAPASPQVQPSKPSATGANQPGAGTPRDPAMLQQAQEFIDQVRSQGKQQTPAPTGVLTAPPSAALPLSQQIGQVGAIGRSTYTQAMRLFGRPPSAREMVIFQGVQALESQLGRPPTRNELLMYVTAPGGSNATGPEPVVG